MINKIKKYFKIIFVVLFPLLLLIFSISLASVIHNNFILKSVCNTTLENAPPAWGCVESRFQQNLKEIVIISILINLLGSIGLSYLLKQKRIIYIIVTVINILIGIASPHSFLFASWLAGSSMQKLVVILPSQEICEDKKYQSSKTTCTFRGCRWTEDKNFGNYYCKSRKKGKYVEGRLILILNSKNDIQQFDQYIEKQTNIKVNKNNNASRTDKITLAHITFDSLQESWDFYQKNPSSTEGFQASQRVTIASTATDKAYSLLLKESLFTEVNKHNKAAYTTISVRPIKSADRKQLESLLEKKYPEIKIVDYDQPLIMYTLIVPAGGEDMWVEKLQGQSFVKSVGRSSLGSINLY